MQKVSTLRQLKAKMALAGISLRTVSKLAGVEYVRCSEILNGHRIDAKRLNKITAAINTASAGLEKALA